MYRGDCSTREVYEGGTKDIALSVVSGINCECSSHMPFTFCCRFIVHLKENSLLQLPKHIMQQLSLRMVKQAVERPTQ